MYVNTYFPKRSPMHTRANATRLSDPQPFYYPEHVGFSIGENDSPKIAVLEIHYNNVKRKPGNLKEKLMIKSCSSLPRVPYMTQWLVRWIMDGVVRVRGLVSLNKQPSSRLRRRLTLQIKGWVGHVCYVRAVFN